MTFPNTWHKVWHLVDDVDTDALAPGAYMQLGIEGIAPNGRLSAPSNAGSLG